MAFRLVAAFVHFEEHAVQLWYIFLMVSPTIATLRGLESSNLLPWQPLLFPLHRLVGR